MKGEKGSLNASSDNIRTDGDTLEENAENNTQPIQFQVAGMQIFIMFLYDRITSCLIFTTGFL